MSSQRPQRSLRVFSCVKNNCVVLAVLLAGIIGGGCAELYFGYGHIAGTANSFCLYFCAKLNKFTLF